MEEIKKFDTIVETDIVEEMKKSYIDYSMSVIVSRALPDVKDGLKPSQRRILMAMKDLALSPTSHYRKCAKIIGDATGNYHPHGDTALYETLVKMAQDFSNRYILVEGQGNFGSVDGDPAAQQRYTEARLSKYSMTMLDNLDKGTVLYSPNYDGTRYEPTVLPALLPNLLCNGCDGIAVGMATKIPPHNLSELIDGIIFMIDEGNKWTGTSKYNELRKLRESQEQIPKILNSEPLSYDENYVSGYKLKDGESLYPYFISDVEVDDLMKYIKGPDFPTSGIIYNIKDIKEVYSTGRGRIVMRAKADIQELKNGKYAIIVSELPYQTNKAFLVEKIANLVKEQKIKGISGLRDESNREGMRVVIEIKRDGKPQAILNKLYKYTDMQKAFNANMIALVDNEPMTLTLKEILEHYLGHRMIVTIRKLEFELSQNLYREHILKGLKIALDNLDEVISTIRASKTQEEAKTNLINKFKLTEVQAQAILDMQLRRLAALERQKIEDELKEVGLNILHLNDILQNESMILTEIKNELLSLKDKLGDTRKTKIIKSALGEINEEDMIPNVPTVVTISNLGYIKRTDPDSYRTQNRGGKGSVASKTKEDDFIEQVFLANTHDSALFFTNKGKVFNLKVYEIPELGKQAKGTPIINFIQIDADEAVTAIFSQSSLSKGTNYFFFATKRGIVKKTKISDYENIRSNGLKAISLNEEDRLSWVKSTTGNNQILIVTEKGKAIRFSEKDVKPTSRNTKGVTGIRFSTKEDFVVGMDIITDENINNLLLSQKGYAKFTTISNYPTQKRGGKGIYTFKVTPKTGSLTLSKLLKDKYSDIMVVSKHGVLIRTELKSIPTLQRRTQGVRVMKLNEGDFVSSIAIIENRDDKENDIKE